MPIIDVEITYRGTLPDDSSMAQRLADAAGEVLGTVPGRTWVKVRYLPGQNYAENGGTPDDMAPIFVSVLLGRGSELTDRSKSALALAVAIARVVDRSADSVHILFEPDAIGRIAFGGKLLT